MMKRATKRTANISAPRPIPTRKAHKFPLPAWYLPKGVINATDNQLELASSSCERWGLVGAGLVVAAVITELIIAWVEPPYNSFLTDSAIADGIIALGITIEVLLGTMWNNRIQTGLRIRSNAKVADAVTHAADANERATKVDLARVELLKQLAPREVNREQFDIIQELKGKFTQINVANETDAETWWFANSIVSALMHAGIKVGQYRRAGDVHSFGVLIYDRAMFSDPEKPLVEGELMRVVRKSGIFRGPLAIVTHLPSDIPASPEVPMIIVGGRFVLSPTRPYVWEAKAVDGMTEK
jgi:hypothetical protein